MSENVEMTRKVLLVDDDTVMLAVVQNQLNRQFEIITAVNGDEALAAVESQGPFAAVVCDMRMPGMDGIEVLGKIREMAPDTVRIMLTGQADLQTAVASINEGNIFRFLTKPCPLKHLVQGIEAGLQQYRLLSAERRLLEQTKHMATHDNLTGLPNRALLMDRLSMALAAARRSGAMVALLFVDLDGFKTVNDTLGHEAGDLLLKAVASKLTACVRETDTVARFGGDEFVIVLTEVRARTAGVKVAKKVIEALSKAVPLNGVETAMGASIGISFFPDHGKTPEELIKQADSAMYAVKNKGKNNYCLSSSGRAATRVTATT